MRLFESRLKSSIPQTQEFKAIMPKHGIVFVCRDNEEHRRLAEQVALHDECLVSFWPVVEDGLRAAQKTTTDIIVIDLGITQSGAPKLIRDFRENNKEAVLIGFIDKPTDDESQYVGMYECFVRPIDIEKLLCVIKKGLDLRRTCANYQRIIHGLQERIGALERQNTLFTQRIEDSARNLTRLYENLRVTYLHTIKVLAQAIDARDHYTHSHSENVLKYATAIAREMGLSAKDVETIGDACQLHDLGKIGVEDNILGKVTALTETEWTQIRRHPVTGAQILKPLTFLNDVIELVRQHHEHYDGSGYPDGRRGEDIPQGARIIHLADAYEAMRSARSYRKIPLTKEAAIQEIKRNSGTQFDPGVVEAFLQVLDKIDPDRI